ncbi:MAG TPA: TlpA disulfide reductase family protein [Candidatus Angelobacter sp.]|nr:TlpA disulfide reductase family protein [Candidatus Angelobacter sp.]
MAALETGVRAPEIELSLTNGQGFSLMEARMLGPVVLAFFKVDCPVCQLTFPYLERMYKSYSASGACTMVGISQDNAADTAAFIQRCGITFPVALDPGDKYPASSAYGLTNVPSIFMISDECEIDESIVSWSKSDMERLNRTLAESSGMPPAEIFPASEDVPDFKLG